MGAWHNDTEMPADTQPEPEPARVVVLPVGTTTAAQAEQWASLHASRWRAQQEEAARRVIDGVPIEHIEPPRMPVLGACSDVMRPATRWDRLAARVRHAWALLLEKAGDRDAWGVLWERVVMAMFGLVLLGLAANWFGD